MGGSASNNIVDRFDRNLVGDLCNKLHDQHSYPSKERSLVQSAGTDRALIQGHRTSFLWGGSVLLLFRSLHPSAILMLCLKRFRPLEAFLILALARFCGEC